MQARRGRSCSTRTGLYRLSATNVQTSEERGLTTLGTTNVLTLTVVVTR